jgi:transcriptional regulator with XRE-family HTH domain
MSRRHELKRLRRRLHWSQYETSKQARLDRSKLSLFENGHISLQPEEEKRLEAALRNGLQSAAKTFADWCGENEQKNKGQG